jgi:hypothetical protein
MGQRCDMCKAACFNGCKNDEGNRGSWSMRQGRPNVRL